MKIFRIAIAFTLLALFSGCATIILGSKEKIKIKTNTPNVNISAGNNFTLKGDSLLIIPKRKLNPQIVLSKQGYESQTFNLTSSKRGSWNSRLNASPIFFGALIWLFGNFKENLAATNNIGYQPSSPQYNNFDPTPYYILGEAIIAGGILSLIIDPITKAARTLTYKELAFDMIPIPAKMKKANMETISCTSAQIKISAGSEIGNVYRSNNGHFERAEKINWEETSDVSSDELGIQINNELNQFGYPVPGMEDKFRNEKKSSRYQISAEINKLNFDKYIHSDYTRLPNQNLPGNIFLLKSTEDKSCKLVINWTVYDNFKGKVVFEKEIPTSVIANDNTFKVLVFKSVSGSLKKLLCDSGFVQAVRKKQTGNNDIIKNDTLFLEKPKIAAEKLPDVVESSITIDLGGGHGSGFMISNEGYALTNYHVVGDEKTVDVILNSGIKLKADVIRRSEKDDVALIKLQGSGFKAVTVNTSEVIVGSNVIAVGSPSSKYLGQSVTKGIVSGKREFDGSVFIQTDVSVSPGNSGGPLINEQNQVIGIITSKIIERGVEGVSFAIPVEVALTKLGMKIGK